MLQEKVTEKKSHASESSSVLIGKDENAPAGSRNEKIMRILEDNTRSNMEALNQLLEAQANILKSLKALEVAIPKRKGSTSAKSTISQVRRNLLHK